MRDRHSVPRIPRALADTDGIPVDEERSNMETTTGEKSYFSSVAVFECPELRCVIEIHREDRANDASY